MAARSIRKPRHLKATPNIDWRRNSNRSAPNSKLPSRLESNYWLGSPPPRIKLPATLPDNLFVKPTHLSEAGARAYTEILARAILAQQDDRNSASAGLPK